MIVGLVSCYKEGHLLAGAVKSAVAGCDGVGVFEGPVGKLPVEKCSLHALPEEERLALGRDIWILPERRYKDDADKRNVALRWVKSKFPNVKELWVLWLDGDEVLIWPEYLRDWAGRAEYVTGVGGFPLRVVELDGSVVFSNNRVVKAAEVDSYLLAASQVLLVNGMVVGLPNEVLCSAGGMPVAPQDATWAEMQAQGDEVMAMWLAKHRPPLAGEPHILHRALMRDPGRGVERQHKPEVEWFDAAGGRHTA